MGYVKGIKHNKYKLVWILKHKTTLFDIYWSNYACSDMVSCTFVKLFLERQKQNQKIRHSKISECYLWNKIGKMLLIVEAYRLQHRVIYSTVLLLCVL